MVIVGVWCSNGNESFGDDPIRYHYTSHLEVVSKPKVCKISSCFSASAVSQKFPNLGVGPWKAARIIVPNFCFRSSNCEGTKISYCMTTGTPIRFTDASSYLEPRFYIIRF